MNQPWQPILFDPADTPTTARLDTGFLVEAQRPQLNNYIRHAQVGHGQHGAVFLCHRIDTKVPIGHPNRRLPVAMKSVRRNNPRAETLRALRRPTNIPTTPHTRVTDLLATTEIKIRKEIAIMKKLRHPHVVRLYEIIDDRLREKIYIVMEYLGGGEVKWHDGANHPVLTLSQTRRIMRDAVRGLTYLHQAGIIHRDIKPANLLWTDDRRQVKIGDFGVSHFCYAQRLASDRADDSTPADGSRMDDDLFQDDRDLTRRAGTPAFLAPEVVWDYTIYKGVTIYQLENEAEHAGRKLPKSLQRPEITKAIDVWALGVTFVCLLTGDTPFLVHRGENHDNTEFELYTAICNEEWKKPTTLGWECASVDGEQGKEVKEIFKLIDRFLDKNSRTRITLPEVKATPWMTRDLPDPASFINDGAVAPAARIAVTRTDTEDAMSAVHFRWRWGLTRQLIVRGVGAFLRGVASTKGINNVTQVGAGSGARIAGPSTSRIRSGSGGAVLSRTGTGRRPWRRAERQEENDEVGAVSAPNVAGGRGKGKEKEKENGKGKGKARETEQLPRAPTRSLRANSPERWLDVRANSTSTSALAATAPPTALTTMTSSAMLTMTSAGHTHKGPPTTATTTAVAARSATSSTPTVVSPNTPVFHAHTHTHGQHAGGITSRAPGPSDAATTARTALAIPSRRVSDARLTSAPGSPTSLASPASRASLASPTSPISLASSAGSVATMATDRSRRFASLFHIANWRPNKYSKTAGTAAAEMHPAGGGTGAMSMSGGTDGTASAPSGRRSAEVLGMMEGAGPSGAYAYAVALGAGPYAPASEEDDDAGRLTAARRAASWGQGDTAAYADLTSVQSMQSIAPAVGAREMAVGAGGGVPPQSTYGASPYAPYAQPPSLYPLPGAGAYARVPMSRGSSPSLSSDEEAEDGDGSPLLTYEPYEQAEDNVRFGQPAWRRTSSIDGSSDGERRTGAATSTSPGATSVAASSRIVGGAADRQGEWRGRSPGRSPGQRDWLPESLQSQSQVPGPSSPSRNRSGGQPTVVPPSEADDDSSDDHASSYSHDDEDDHDDDNDDDDDDDGGDDDSDDDDALIVVRRTTS